MHQYIFVKLLHPRHWPSWLAMCILRLLVFLPFRLQLTLGRQIGQLLFLFPSKMKRTIETNLNLCFPDMSMHARQMLLRDNLTSIGMAIFESGMGWWASNSRLQKISVTIKGSLTLSQKDAGKGILLCSPHFSTLELTGRLFALHTPISVMSRPQKNPVIDFIVSQSRRRHYRRVISRHDIRGMINALKNGEIVWYAPDIDAGTKNSVFVNFFNVQAATITATSRYAKMTGAKVIPAFFYRHPTGHYEIQLEPCLQQFPTEDLAIDAQRINHLFEHAILAQPEQYLWLYKRFKTRPHREKRFYS